jgi:hypothetical protein
MVISSPVKNPGAWIPYLWAASVMLQALICAILIFRGYFRLLPFFTAYVALNLAQAGFLHVVYARYDPRSNFAYARAWQSEGVTLIAKVFATVELLRLVLLSYRGIWGLAWRLLTVTCAVALVGVGIAARGQADWAMLEADRGYNLIFATAVIACLALVRYYRIRVEPTYQILLAGFCFYSCIKILVNTILQGYLFRQVPEFEPLWQAISISAYVLLLVVWTVALLRPVPAAARQGPTLPASTYTQLGPEIHSQLRAINEKLMDFWKIKEPRR